jgi:hypothetical protein
VGSKALARISKFNFRYKKMFIWEKRCYFACPFKPYILLLFQLAFSFQQDPITKIIPSSLYCTPRPFPTDETILLVSKAEMFPLKLFSLFFSSSLTLRWQNVLELVDKTTTGEQSFLYRNDDTNIRAHYESYISQNQCFLLVSKTSSNKNPSSRQGGCYITTMTAKNTGSLKGLVAKTI